MTNSLAKNPDKLDRALVDALSGNIRRSTRDLAETLGVSPATVKRRLQRLLDAQQIILAPLVDLYAAGFDYLLMIGLTVAGRPVAEVAKEVAALPAALTVNLARGNHHIDMVAALPDRHALGQLLGLHLPQIDGIASQDPAMALEVWKFGYSHGAADVHSPAPIKPPLDQLDINIAQQLFANCRQSNRAIGQTLGVSESAVRVRLKKMLQHNQLRLNTVIDLSGGPIAAAFIGIDCQMSKAAEVCRQLALIEEVSFVCTCLGRHDIMATVNVTDPALLKQVCQKISEQVDGINALDVSECQQQLKNQFNYGLLL
ncbi:MAG: Lrp/AsnC family transcriptional regulator [Cellvibrionaceae bacterium]|nr:Lrp/AsnC family transcriptional regulator [Cellvibrionaceae bacterium]